MVHHSVPVPCLTQLEATAVQVTLAGRPEKILAAFLSHPRPLIGADLTACFGRRLPLMAGDLIAKHVNWNSRLNKRRGKLVLDYADENSCLIFGPDTPTTSPPLPRYLGHCEEPPVPGISDFVYLTKFGPPPSTHRNCVSLILSNPTGSPSF